MTLFPVSIALAAAPSRRDERGMSMSVFVCVSIFALIVAAGLAIDGAVQVHARRVCQTAAAEIARAGADSSATDRLAGESSARAALDAANVAATRYPDLAVTASISPSGDEIVVPAQTTVDTYFITLIGIDHLSAHGDAAADLTVG
jgi:hypothetical protein